MTEKDIQSIPNIEKITVLPEQSGCDKPFHYYTLDINNDDISFISNANDEVQNDNNWYMEIFNTSTIKFYDIDEFIILINLLIKNTIQMDDLTYLEKEAMKIFNLSYNDILINRQLVKEESKPEHLVFLHRIENDLDLTELQKELWDRIVRNLPKPPEDRKLSEDGKTIKKPKKLI